MTSHEEKLYGVILALLPSQGVEFCPIRHRNINFYRGYSENN
nr:MAG TPA: hypothetical protein [Caudoviricetes sp.]